LAEFNQFFLDEKIKASAILKLSQNEGLLVNWSLFSNEDEKKSTLHLGWSLLW